MLNKLRPAGPSLTETLEEEVLKHVLAQLFPRKEEDENRTSITDSDEPMEEEDFEVSTMEVTAIVKRKQGQNKTPGRNGIPMRAIGCLPKEGYHLLASLFLRCFREGKFPERWKRAVLVLITKELPLDLTNPKVRPICLLDKLGKI